MCDHPHMDWIEGLNSPHSVNRFPYSYGPSVWQSKCSWSARIILRIQQNWTKLLSRSTNKAAPPSQIVSVNLIRVSDLLSQYLCWTSISLIKNIKPGPIQHPFWSFFSPDSIYELHQVLLKTSHFVAQAVVIRDRQTRSIKASANGE